MALRHPLRVDQGSDFAESVSVLDSNDQLENVEDWTAVGQVRANYDSSSVLHNLDLTPSDTNVVVKIPGSVSSTWTWLIARYDIKLTAPDNKTTRLLSGWVIVDPQVTR